MKNKMLFFSFLILSFISAFQNNYINSAEFIEMVFSDNYFDPKVQVKSCINLIRNEDYDFEQFKDYFQTNRVDANLKLELEENDDEEMNEKESKESSESYSKKDNGKTLLMFAVEKGDLRLIEFLISKGADVNAMTQDCQMTPLSIAVLKNDINLARLLINNKANINCNEYEVDIEDNNLFIQNVLPIYFMKSEVKLEMVRLFLDKDYDLQATVENNSGYNIIEFVIMQYDSSMINKQIIAMLLDQAKKANIDLNKFDFISAALKSGKINIIKYLMKLGFININTKNESEDNLLNCAAISGNLELVEFAIKCGSDVNCQSEGDCTSALMLACNNGHAHVVVELLNAGADINLKDGDEWSCIDYLNEHNDPDGAIRDILYQWSVLTAKEVIKTTGLPREISGLVVDILNNEQLSSQELAEIDRSVLKEEADKKAFVERQAARIANKISKAYNQFTKKDSLVERSLEKEVQQKKRKR